MECPHLSTTPNGEICRLMVEQKLDGELDDFDIIHYCKGNQNHCYFYRSCRVRKPAAEQLEESKPERIRVASFDELFMLKPKEAEISINNDETHPLLSKLIERGFCHKLRPEFVERLIMRLRRK